MIQGRVLARDLFVAYARYENLLFSMFDYLKLQSSKLDLTKLLSNGVIKFCCCRCYKHEFLKDFFLSTGQIHVRFLIKFFFDLFS